MAWVTFVKISRHCSQAIRFHSSCLETREQSQGPSIQQKVKCKAIKVNEVMSKVLMSISDADWNLKTKAQHFVLGCFILNNILNNTFNITVEVDL